MGIIFRATALMIPKKLQCFPQVETKGSLRLRVISSAFDESVAAVKEHIGVQCHTGNKSVIKLFDSTAKHV